MKRAIQNDSSPLLEKQIEKRIIITRRLFMENQELF
jgi:hypothetical protein